MYNKSYVESIDDHNGAFVSRAFDPNVFADLIIKECMKRVKWVGDVNAQLNLPKATAYAINRRITKKFGVKND